MGLAPLLDSFFVLIAFGDITLLAQALEVVPVVEAGVAADGIWRNVIHDFGRLNLSFLQALGAERVILPPRLGQPRPVVGVVKVR